MGEPSGVNQSISPWKSVWKLGVVGKVKFFIWKAISNLLPTKGNLYKKKSAENPLCPVCNKVEETVLHGLWECVAAREVWGERDSQVSKSGKVFENFADLWMEFSSKLDERGLELVSVICYRLWLRRNDLIFRNFFCGPKHLIKAACTDITDFSMAIVEPKEGEIQVHLQSKEGKAETNIAYGNLHLEQG
ncbi:uncharacterized protein LOC122291086 [Carya illinoinensis]|uniref:uncharacterized protein LOC122291086 n=1 Tax=Carya illinoinensis TaxID=32201 RepID=UPI001C719BFB|nr:uncharacterized protein LOC122291086 [Carya illinoinensis]